MKYKGFYILSVIDTARLLIGAMLILLLFISSTGISGTNILPAPEEVDLIWIEPHDGKIKDFYTPGSLLKALPHLQETT